MAVTQADVAARAGVSRSLVSLVMRGSPEVKEAKRAAVLKAAEELSYRPNAHAAQLASHQSKILGVVLSELRSPIVGQFLQPTEVEAEARGYGLLTTLCDADPEQERRAISRLLSHRVDGLMLFATRLPAAEVQKLAAQVPVVVAGRAISGVQSVSVDSRAGARLAVEHLVDLGHHDIAHIDGGDGPGARSRRRGYRDVMQAAGLDRHSRVVGGDYTEAAGIAAAEALLRSETPPTAIFAANDLTAMGVLAAVQRRGLRVPDDLSLVGFDDTPLASLAYINLTTIAQPRDTMAAKTVTALLARIEDPSRPVRSVLTAPHLIARSTTTTPKRAHTDVNVSGTGLTA